MDRRKFLGASNSDLRDDLIRLALAVDALTEIMQKTVLPEGSGKLI